MHRLRIIGVLTIILFCLSSSQFESKAHAQSEIDDQTMALEEAWDMEQEAIKKITELGGWYVIGDCLSDDMKPNVDLEKHLFVVEVNMVYTEEGGRQDNDNMSSEALQYIALCTQVKRVLLKATQANDEQLKHLVDLGQIEQLYIWNADEVSDEGLKHLIGLKKLNKLHVSNSKITDEGIGLLTELPDVESLSLQGNSFTDKIFEHAAKFENLKSVVVGLGDSDMTDEGLQRLYECDKLEKLGIQQTGISSEAVELLKEKLPNLSTVYHRFVP